MRCPSAPHPYSLILKKTTAPLDKMYSIYANPEHVHFLVSRDPNMSENALADLIADASEIFINNNNLCKGKFY